MLTLHTPRTYFFLIQDSGGAARKLRMFSLLFTASCIKKKECCALAYSFALDLLWKEIKSNFTDGTQSPDLDC